MWAGEAEAQADISQPTPLLRPSLEHLARSSEPFCAPSHQLRFLSLRRTLSPAPKPTCFSVPSEARSR